MWDFGIKRVKHSTRNIELSKMVVKNRTYPKAVPITPLRKYLQIELQLKHTHY
jgi:hypothetical protein